MNFLLTQLLAVSLIGGMGSSNGILPENQSCSDELTIIKCEDFEVTGDGAYGSWSSAEWVTIQKRTDNSVTYNTKAKAMYSETGIYFLFDCQDEKLTTTLNGDNLDLYEEDVVEVFLWTGEDFPVYFEYEISPLNYELTIMVPNHKGHFFGWLPWHYEGERKTRHATSTKGGPKEHGASVEGWMTEFFIPYELLTPLPQVPPKSGTRWRANMYRIDYDHGQTLFTWQEIRRTFHDYENYGTFVFE